MSTQKAACLPEAGIWWRRLVCYDGKEGGTKHNAEYAQRSRCPVGLISPVKGKNAAEGDNLICGRYYIADEDLSEEPERIIEEINRKKTPEGMKPPVKFSRLILSKRLPTAVNRTCRPSPYAGAIRFRITARSSTPGQRLRQKNRCSEMECASAAA